MAKILAGTVLIVVGGGILATVILIVCVVRAIRRGSR